MCTISATTSSVCDVLNEVECRWPHRHCNEGIGQQCADSRGLGLRKGHNMSHKLEEGRESDYVPSESPD